MYRMSAAAGWYEDPNNELRQRWWDGHAWTRDTRDLPLPAAQPSEPDLRVPLPGESVHEYMDRLIAESHGMLDPVALAHAYFHRWEVDPSWPKPPFRSYGSAVWISDRLLEELELQGLPQSLLGRESVFLPVVPPPMPAQELADLNNLVVGLARSAMVRAKNEGAATTKVRTGLKLPTDWVAHYRELFVDESANILLNAMMQNAMLQNPFAGERKPWKSW